MLWKRKVFREPDSVEYYGVFKKVKCPDKDFFNTANLQVPKGVKKERVIVSSNVIIMKCDGYKILEYGCRHTGEDSKYYLNGFCKSITVMLVEKGTKLALLGDRLFVEEIPEMSIIPYYTDNNNCNCIIEQEDLRKILYQRADLTLSKEGIIIFHTSNSMLATIDCHSVYNFNIEDCEILNVRNKVSTEYDKHFVEVTLRGDYQSRNHCSFDVDFSEEQPRINCRVIPEFADKSKA